jgi:flagellar basal-body rod protein FlgB
MDGRGGYQAILTQVLDVASLRHRVIAQNIANVNTPGYRRLAVEFEGDFARALAASRPSGHAGPSGHGGRSDAVPHVEPRVVVEDGPERVDGNTVDIDREVNDLGNNTQLYSAALQIITHQVASRRAAIAGR